MHITKKFDRAFQWAGEKMGGEARTSHNEEFRTLEADMNVRNHGTERLQKSMNLYVRWLGRRCDPLEDRDRTTPTALFGRTMAAHGEEYEADSQLGNSLVAVGQANERIASIQESFLEQANATWGGSLEQRAAMMKEYQTARKKLESRRLAYDASNAKMEKARRDDFRVEEEVRNNRTKFEESSDDVLQRMQDIKEAESDGVAALNEFLDAQLEYHERCAEELRRARDTISGAANYSSSRSQEPPVPRPRAGSRPIAPSRSNSRQDARSIATYDEPQQSEHCEPGPPAPPAPRVAARRPSAPPQPPRPVISRAATAPRTAAAAPLPVSKVRGDASYLRGGDDVFADDTSTASGSGSPNYGGQTLSPATSYGSLSRSLGPGVGGAKVPPPVNRAKKPAPPPVPTRKENLGF
ncbi:Bin/amphiphysin/Rvs domain for vesicular trafficking [Geosmithia morbida]|uniref:Bin/amphiphysin/Rvs domain for vesicular trafficking n=1 Tax=Geosmithia morbida TaxID=1094350 RepID=A0A9P4YUJ2_9HYPO|nr:Bin/amphiphysin/Rvs domain for vesicular trafficking [Geosmithia morbida]KAF4121948.1 Bin/amphiphysin/Rvs domain for vesicular trafficking [Geosmithia morbida]